MKKTIDCVREYVKDMLEFGIASKYTRANSCYAIRNFFVSYNTPICEFDPETQKFKLATKKYSVTTSKQQTYLRNSIPEDKIVEVEEIKNPHFPFAR